YHTFILFSFIMAFIIYPVTGHWIWGGGFLGQKGFWDFAGCSAVHSVGGWAALTGAWILGPRIGKYGADGRPKALPGHNMTAAFIGCLVLWFGWFGFNPGSTMGVAGDGGVAAAQVAVNTNSAAAAATLTATLTAWLLLGKPDIGMTLNGCLAGLVGITASAAYVTVPASLLIGAIAGWLAGVLVKGSGFGLIGDIVVGIVGAVFGGWLFPTLGFSLGDPLIGSLVTAILGAVILIFLIRLIKRV
ncbi:MAG: GlsB/YeaQ/YmgE family stress response membrane protein, partial [Planctomycetota bacterium]